MDHGLTVRIATAPLVVAVVLGLAMVLAAPRAGHGSDDTIEGQIRLTTGGALPPVIRVSLEIAQNTVVEQQLVGTTAKFVFYNLKEQNYQVTVTADGFQPATAVVDMHYLASRFPTIYLNPSPPKKTPPPPADSTTNLAAPKNARKEFEKGYAALTNKDLNTARDHSQKAVDLDPCYARALTALGVVHSLEKDSTGAESSIKKAIQCDGGFLESYIQMQTLLDSEKKYEECESILQQGIRVAPSRWQLHYGLGIEHHHLGEYQPATEKYLKAESLSPAVPPDVHVRLADAYLELKRYDQASLEMRNYLRVAPNGPLAEQTKAMLERLDSMRNSEGPPARDSHKN